MTVQDLASALLTALDWASERDLAAADEVELLRRAVKGDQPLRLEDYDTLRAFTQVLFGVDGAPTITTGDAVEFLSQRGLPPAAGEPGATWRLRPQPSPDAFSRLGFDETSKGIAEGHRNNRDGWEGHVTNSKAFINDACRKFAGRSALVLGVGKAYDIPLRDLARSYEQLILVDVDAPALRETADRVLRGIPEHVHLVQQDVSGIIDAFVDRLEAALGASTEHDFYQVLVELLLSYRLAEPPELFPLDLVPGGRVDDAYSPMLMSQLATPLTQAARRAFSTRWPQSGLPDTPEFQVALNIFTHRVQHDHLRALSACSNSFVVTTDFAAQKIKLGPQGIVPTSKWMSLAAAERVQELVPALGFGTANGAIRQVELVRAAEWVWPMVVPKKLGRSGVLTNVQAAMLRCKDATQ